MKLKAAVQILRDGGLVAIPTETVYGLAADARRADAVANIFALKGRPAANPVIVHVHSVDAAQACAAEWPDMAATLAATFWPGPLTLVVKKNDTIPAIVTAGGPTVGLRMPDHRMTLRLLGVFNGPLAAPSANRSNHISPTTAQHVREEFGDAVPMIIDGGPCRYGIESTVVDVTGDTWRVLRPGSIPAEHIHRAITGGKGMDDDNEFVLPTLHEGPPPGQMVRSPGQLDVHYAPRTPAFRFEANERHGIDLTNAVVLEPTLDPDAYARNLYARLRMLDTQGLDAIYIEMPPDVQPWRAVRDRLMRATKPLPYDRTIKN